MSKIGFKCLNKKKFQNSISNLKYNGFVAKLIFSQSIKLLLFIENYLKIISTNTLHCTHE